MTSNTPGEATGASGIDQLAPRPPLTTRLRTGHWVALDAVIAMVFALVFLAGSTHPAYRIPVSIAYLFALASTLPAAVRRLWPLPVLAITTAGSVAAMAIGTEKDPSVVVAFVLYMTGLRYPRRTSALIGIGVLAATAAGTVAAAAALPRDQFSGAASHIVGSAVFLAAGWAIGVAVSQQRAHAALLREQAEQRAKAQLAEGRRAVTEERLRIARELHDVVAHSLSLIAVQAGVGNYVAGARPAEAARTLASIEATSRDALREMRRLLGVLRDERGGTQPASAHGLADLGQLITGTAEAGVQTELEIRGTQRPVPPGSGLAAYRIIQEALTNVVKHARTTACQVTVTYTDDAICLEITDDGNGATTPAAVPGTGHGIIGMRERASLYGGELHAGPLPGSGFRVTARLPLDREPVDTEPAEPADRAVT